VAVFGPGNTGINNAGSNIPAAVIGTLSAENSRLCLDSALLKQILKSKNPWILQK
jgi:hypothetical protein